LHVRSNIWIKSRISLFRLDKLPDLILIKSRISQSRLDELPDLDKPQVFTTTFLPPGLDLPWWRAAASVPRASPPRAQSELVRCQGAPYKQRSSVQIKGTWYRFKFASKRSLEPSFFLHGFHIHKTC